MLNRHLIYQGNLDRSWLDTFQNAMYSRLEADYNPLAQFNDGKAEEACGNAAAFCARIHRYLLAAGFMDAELAASRS